MTRSPSAGRGMQVFAAALGALSVVLAVLAAIVCVLVGWTWAEALDSFVLSNAWLGVTFATCGAILAWHRRRNPIGWLFLVGGLSQVTAAAAAPLGQLLVDVGAEVWLLRSVLTVFLWSWPLAIGLCIPLALLLFPDGKPPAPGWRPVVVGVIVTAPLFSLEMGLAPTPVEPGLPLSYLTLPSYDALQPLWWAAELRGLLVYLLALVALGVRYLRGPESARRQLLWLILALVITLAAISVWGLVANSSILVLFTIALIPIAVTVAVVRYQLLDIRLVLARALAWVLLSLAVLLAYVALVAVLDRFVSAQLGRSALVTVVLVLVAAPVLPRLQRLVDGAVYGDRGNPSRVLAAFGDQLATGDSDLAGTVSTVRAALRLPYVALNRHGETVTSDGERPERTHQWPLTYQGHTVGELVLGLRSGERVVTSADRTVLGVLSAPLAVALHATEMSAELQESREQIVGAQAEERRRLRRELHDGLGPTLTGIAFTAD
ncbi:MAG: two-component sensor histidine kinase, partial [Propionibacteriaceae bacterium]